MRHASILFQRKAAAVAMMFVASLALEDTQAADMGVFVSNRTSEQIQNIYVSPTWAPDGRSDALGVHVIRPGATRLVDFDTADAQGECRLDLLAVGLRGTRWRHRMDVCRGVSWDVRDD